MIEQPSFLTSGAVDEKNASSNLFIGSPIFDVGATYLKPNPFLRSFLNPLLCGKLEDTTANTSQIESSYAGKLRESNRSLAEKVFGSLRTDEKTLKEILNEFDDEFGLY